MGFEQDQETARRFDSQEAATAAEKGLTAPEPTRFLFSATDGGELSSRWDMQQSPPDILVTNVSMLGTMLSREVEAPIFESTRQWLGGNVDAYFYLVLDELHLVRGSAGTEVSGLVRALIHRLGLDRPEHRHKLRILASSASLPLEGQDGERSTRYLHDFFGPFGTFEKPGASGASDPQFWRECVVPGISDPTRARRAGCARPGALRRLADLLTDGGKTIGRPTERTPALDEAMSEAFVALCSAPAPADASSAAKRAVDAAAAVLVHACRSAEEGGRVRATGIDILSDRIFGAKDAPGFTAMHGLTLLRGLGDHLKTLYGSTPADGTTSFRAHIFLRSIEGLFATIRESDDGLLFDGPTIERGTTYTLDSSDGPRRTFELVYCEACGDVYVGGRRGRSSQGSDELLPASPELEKLPELGTTGHYEDLSYDDFAVFWPSRNDAAVGEEPEEWAEAILDTRTGQVVRAAMLRPRPTQSFVDGCSGGGARETTMHGLGPRADVLPILWHGLQPADEGTPLARSKLSHGLRQEFPARCDGTLRAAQGERSRCESGSLFR